MNVVWKKRITLEPFRPLYETDATLIFVWGGRDSGKSFAIPQVLTRKALKYNEFRLMAIRKNLNTIKTSTFDVFNNFIEKKGLSSLVKTTKTPLEIKFTNGADILGRGCDDPAKIKSTTNPSDAWIEEADQITEDDFDTILTTLRSNSVPIQCWLTFNPEVDKTGKSWIKERFFKNLTEDEMYSPYHEFSIEVRTENKVTQIKCLSIHVTCDINPHADELRIATYDSYKEININKYNVWRWGRWGRKEVNSPFAWAFNETKHVKECEVNTDLPLDIVFDFNNVPCTATISQQDHNRTWKKVLYEIRLGTKEDKGDIYQVVDRIKKIIPLNSYIRISGDATGRGSNALVKGNTGAYDIIRERFLSLEDTGISFQIAKSHFMQPSINPGHEASYFYVNERLVQREVIIHPRCLYLIEDLKQVEYKSGSILKKEAESKGMGHVLDCFRYDFHTFFY